jgi:2-polyprenyl-6-methoxyphenol hydroxylase-like FAD-dependent oxidoreductase
MRRGASEGHAVVVGASLAGLCAARVLSDFFPRVTLVERDRLPAGAEDRPGVPQGRHVHALLARGTIELERLFPGFRRRLLDRGVVELDFGLDAAVLRPYGWAPRQAFGIPLLLASRRLVESVVREAVSRLPGVTRFERSAATALRVESRDGRRRAVGVRLVSEERGTVDLGADLVVDASGRETKAPDWLRAVGLEPPAETVIDPFAGYSTRWFAAPDRLPDRWWWKAIVIEPRPPGSWLGAVLVPVEDRQWMVTLGGVSRHYPPTDEQGYTAMLGEIRSPLIAEAVRLACPVTPVYGNRQMANRRRHYESWAGGLDGFVAVGDSVCAFNPIYGQGMTTAALCAGALEKTLAGVDPAAADFARRFFRAQAAAQNDAWALATGADLRLPDTVGRRSLAARLFAGYGDALVFATRDDPVVHRRFFEVLQMLRPVSALSSPAIAVRVAWRDLRRRIARERRLSRPGTLVPMVTDRDPTNR